MPSTNPNNEGQQDVGDYGVILENVGQDVLGAEDIDRQGDDGGNRPSTNLFCPFCRLLRAPPPARPPKVLTNLSTDLTMPESTSNMGKLLGMSEE